MSSLQDRIGKLRYQEQLLDPLIRLLAKSHSQQSIAEILNSRGLLTLNEKLWTQPKVSQYFAAEGLTPAFKFRGNPTPSFDQNEPAIQGQTDAEIQQQQ